VSEKIRARGVVVRKPGARAEVEEIVLSPPAAGEVLVRIVATGVCHTDLHTKHGHFGRDFPYLLGHEATAVVEAVGEGVERPAVGDTVMLNWRAPCGRCEFCDAGRPTHCRRPVTAGERMFTQEGDALGRVLGLGTFATHSVVAAAQCVPCDASLSATATCLIGCGVVTGIGAVLFANEVGAGQTVAVYGCGAVGVSVIMGAKLARASRIIAVDRVAQKLEWAKKLGATDVIDASSADPVATIKELCGGVDHAFEAIGLPETLAQAVKSCRLAGNATLIGVPHPKAEVSLSMAKLFYSRITLRSTFYGDCLPSRDFPLIAEWYRNGELPLDELVTKTIGIGDVETAFEAMERGETLRSVIVF
jgi:S-(hydroxymethyl)mycothiol dehydrogenase